MVPTTISGRYKLTYDAGVCGGKLGPRRKYKGGRKGKEGLAYHVCQTCGTRYDLAEAWGAG